MLYEAWEADFVGIYMDRRLMELEAIFQRPIGSTMAATHPEIARAHAHAFAHT